MNIVIHIPDEYGKEKYQRDQMGIESEFFCEKKKRIGEKVGQKN